MAMAGALVRNFVDARVRTVEQLLDSPVDATVMLCPNFHLLGDKAMPQWRAQKLYDMLLDRYQRDLPSVVWSESPENIKDYGRPMKDLLDGFQTSKVQ